MSPLHYFTTMLKKIGQNSSKSYEMSNWKWNSKKKLNLLLLAAFCFQIAILPLPPHFSAPEQNTPFSKQDVLCTSLEGSTSSHKHSLPPMRPLNECDIHLRWHNSKVKSGNLPPKWKISELSFEEWWKQPWYWSS